MLECFGQIKLNKLHTCVILSGAEEVSDGMRAMG